MKSFILVVGLLLLIALEFLRVYFIMPFPGSQHKNTLQIAYWISKNIWWMRAILLLAIVMPALGVYSQPSKWKRILLICALAFYGVIYLLFNFRMQADKMFYQPSYKWMATAKDNKITADKLVIGIVMNGEAKAYPIQLIGYHHQVKDTVGNTPVLVTYCTVCRTGRVYSPMVNGKPEIFRLVGMDHFNAMFEDVTTKSWWQQATGVAIAGPLQGTSLNEIASTQLTLGSWLKMYPSSLIMQPDSNYKKEYEDLADFDKGTTKGSLEKRDSVSWQNKSWVVGIKHNDVSKAYDWNELVNKKIIQDSVAGLPVLLVMEKDSVAFHAWNRTVGGTVLQFDNNITVDYFKDINTASLWNMNGQCIEGPLKDSTLKTIQAYQEFWHSWQNFHPGTLK
jgi:hypothetical protein